MDESPRRRQSATITRQVMLDQGVSMLSRHGLKVSLDGLSIDRCLEELDIARSSAYHAWTDDSMEAMPQQLYQRAVLRQFIVATSDAGLVRTFEDGAASALATSTIRTREDLRRAINTDGAILHLRKVMLDRDLRVRVALLFAATSVPGQDRDEELLQWLRESRQQRLDQMIEFALKPLARACGLRPRPRLDGPDFWQRLAISFQAFAIGLIPSLAMASPEDAPDLDGNNPLDPTWRALTEGLDACVVAYLENDPDSDIELPSESDL